MSNEVNSNFRTAFPGGGGITIECGCGRLHFGDERSSYDWNDGEFAHLTEQMKKHPDKYEHHEGYDGVDYSTVMGRTYVYGCPCDYGPKVQAMLWNNRFGIAEFLLSESNDNLAADLRVHNEVRNASLAIDRLEKAEIMADDAAERLKDV